MQELINEWYAIEFDRDLAFYYRICELYFDGIFCSLCIIHEYYQREDIYEQICYKIFVM